jgi:isopentenyl diphosphate isomerase/L-lactate dehydrogenase-like FMN-dependent dehydrogenase
MAKKSVAKKSVARKTQVPTAKTVKIKTMKGGVVVQGSITAKRDVIMGNQYNDYRRQIAQIATPQQFIAEAEKVQQQIAEVKQHPALPPAQQRRIEAIEGDVKEVIAEAKKDKPSPKTMSDTLKTAAETMEGVGKAIDAAGKVGTKVDEVIIKGMDWGRIAVGLGTLANIAIKLFGG